MSHGLASDVKMDYSCYNPDSCCCAAVLVDDEAPFANHVNDEPCDVGQILVDEIEPGEKRKAENPLQHVSTVMKSDEVPIPDQLNYDPNNSETRNESRSLLSNSNSSLPINELNLIPRNKINTFKSFRNCTFKLVPSDEFSSCLIKNSNNSNRFVNKPNKSIANSEESMYINRINKNVMLRKITEIARPYLHDKSISVREFKRIIPHPIIDENRNTDLINLPPFSDKSAARCNQNTGANSPQMSLNSILPHDNFLPAKVEPPKAPPINLDEYEKLLEEKLNEIRKLRDKPAVVQNEVSSSTKEAEPMLVCCAAKISESEEKFARQRSVSCAAKLSKPNQTRNLKVSQKPDGDSDRIQNPCNTNSQPYLQCHEKELKMDSNKTNKTESSKGKHFESTLYFECNQEASYKSNKFTSVSTLNLTKAEQFESHSSCNSNMSNEIVVSVDELKLNKELIHSKNMHLPLYFKCDSGKKLRFKIRYLNQLGQALKAFCTRMGVKLMSEITFYAPSGQLIGLADTPYSLLLKPHDIITVKNAESFAFC